MDVMALERELSDEPDPHATLPFISHHTLNLSRDLEDTKTKQTKGLADIQEEKSNVNTCVSPCVTVWLKLNNITF